MIGSLPSVSILIHYTCEDLRHDSVIRKDKRLVSVDEILGQIDGLEADVRHIIRGICFRADAVPANTFPD